MYYIYKRERERYIAKQEGAKMELRQLEYFYMASRLRNITRAAQRLHVSQPNITVAIQKLESELGVQLLDRSQKVLTLTPEGTVFLSRIEVALENIRNAVRELDDYKTLQKGIVRLGIPPIVGAYLFPRIFSHFSHQYPSLELSIVEDGSLAIRHALENGELDLGMVITTGVGNLLSTEPILKEEIVVCLPKSHRLAGRESIALEELAGERLIMLKQGSYHRQVLMSAFDALSIKPNIILSSNQVETIKGLVARQVGVSFLPRVVVEESDRLSAVSLEEPLYIDIGLAWKKDSYISRAGRAFIDFCSAYLKKN